MGSALLCHVKRLEKVINKSFTRTVCGRPWNGKMYLVLFDDDPEPSPDYLAHYQFTRFDGVIRIPFIDGQQAAEEVERIAEEMAPADIDFSLSAFDKVRAVCDYWSKKWKDQMLKEGKYEQGIKTGD